MFISYVPWCCKGITTMGPYFRRHMFGSEWQETNHFLILFELCHELNMFVNLKDYF